MDGLFVIDKPEGWTSHDVVGKFRGIARTRRVGHLGTLDPIATGLLPLVVNQATRLARFYSKANKTYEAVIRFGFSTDTYDRAGKATSEAAEPGLRMDRLDAALASFRGKLLQMPPQYSAKKVAGVAAYKSARQNIEVVLTPVEVEIFKLQLTAVDGPDVSLTIECSAGTYVRSIAHELGQALGSGAHLQALRRIASGDFTIARAHGLEELQILARENRLDEALIPMTEMLPEFFLTEVDDLTAGHIRQGRNFHVSPFRARPDATHVKAVSRTGNLIAIGEAVLPNVYHPVIVFAESQNHNPDSLE